MGPARKTESYEGHRKRLLEHMPTRGGNKRPFTYAAWPFKLTEGLVARGFKADECWAFKCLYDLAVEYKTFEIPKAALRLSYLTHRCPGCHWRTIKSAILKGCTCPDHGVQALPRLLNERGQPVDRWAISVDNLLECPTSCAEKYLTTQSSGNLSVSGATGLLLDLVRYKRDNNKTAGIRWSSLITQLTSRTGLKPGNKQERRVAGMLRVYGEDRVRWAVEQLPHGKDLNLDELGRLCGGNGHPFNGPLFERAVHG